MDRKTGLFIWIFILVLVGLACSALSEQTTAAPTSLVALPTQAEIGFPTANLTLTSVFSVTEEPATLAPEPTEREQTSHGAVPTSLLDDLYETATAVAPRTATPKSTLIPVETQIGALLDFNAITTVVSNERRSGPALVAAYQENVPTIDGDPGDWTSSLYLADEPVFGEGYTNGDDDISADFKLGWDLDNLYLAVVVRDSKFVQEAEGTQLWLGDSLEIMMDTNVSADYSNKQISADDFHIGFSPGQLDQKKGNPPEVFIWEPPGKFGSNDDIDIAFLKTDDGYLMEAAIPWELYDVTPTSSMHFGFFFSVTDNDAIDSFRQQTIVSFASERNTYDPTTWTDLILQ